MSIELDLLLVDEQLLRTYAHDPLLIGIWNSRYLLHLFQGDEPAIAEAHQYWKLICDPTKFHRTWEQIERLSKQGGLPSRRLQIGSDWLRIDDRFAQETSEEKGKLLRAAFYGIHEPTVRLEASYGPCKLVYAEDARAIARQLRSVDIAYLRSLAPRSTAEQRSTQSLQRGSPDLAQTFGLSPDTLVTDAPEFFAATTADFVFPSQQEPDEVDLENVRSLAGFYESAASKGCGVICGIS
jgi:hypothetical protein